VKIIDANIGLQQAPAELGMGEQPIRG